MKTTTASSLDTPIRLPAAILIKDIFQIQSGFCKMPEKLSIWLTPRDSAKGSQRFLVPLGDIGKFQGWQEISCMYSFDTNRIFQQSYVIS